MSDFGVLINIWIYISNHDLSLPNDFFADHVFELDAPRLQLTERETGRFAYCVFVKVYGDCLNISFPLYANMLLCRVNIQTFKRGNQSVFNQYWIFQLTLGACDKSVKWIWISNINLWNDYLNIYFIAKEYSSVRIKTDSSDRLDGVKISYALPTDYDGLFSI